MNTWIVGLPPKEKLYSNLNMEDITNNDYDHASDVYKTCNIDNLSEYYDLYVQSDDRSLLLLDDVFNDF